MTLNPCCRSPGSHRGTGANRCWRKVTALKSFAVPIFTATVGGGGGHISPQQVVSSAMAPLSLGWPSRTRTTGFFHVSLHRPVLAPENERRSWQRSLCLGRGWPARNHSREVVSQCFCFHDCIVCIWRRDKLANKNNCVVATAATGSFDRDKWQRSKCQRTAMMQCENANSVAAALATCASKHVCLQKSCWQ